MPETIKPTQTTQTTQTPPSKSSPSTLTFHGEKRSEPVGPKTEELVFTVNGKRQLTPQELAVRQFANHGHFKPAQQAPQTMEPNGSPYKMKDDQELIARFRISL